MASQSKRVVFNAHPEKPWLGVGYSSGAEDASDYEGSNRKGGNKKKKQRKQDPDAQGPALLEKPVAAPKRPGVPNVLSFFNGIVSARGQMVKWIDTYGGVPTRLKSSVGYWYGYDKDSLEGDQITVWYYYEQGDGPFPNARYGDKIRGARVEWVKRPQLKDDARSDSHVVTYDPDMKRNRGLTTGLRWRSSRPANSQSGYATPTATPRGRRPGVSYSGVVSGSEYSSASSAVSSRASSPDRSRPASQMSSITTLAKASSLLETLAATTGQSFDVTDVVTMANVMASGPENSDFEGFQKPKNKNKKKKKKQVTVSEPETTDFESEDESAKPKQQRKKKDNGEKKNDNKPYFKHICPEGNFEKVFAGSPAACGCPDNKDVWDVRGEVIPSAHYTRAHAEFFVGTSGEHFTAVQMVVNYQVPNAAIPHIVWLQAHAGDSMDSDTAIKYADVIKQAIDCGCHNARKPSTDWDATVEAETSQAVGVNESSQPPPRDQRPVKEPQPTVQHIVEVIVNNPGVQEVNKTDAPQEAPKAEAQPTLKKVSKFTAGAPDAVSSGTAPEGATIKSAPTENLGFVKPNALDMRKTPEVTIQLNKPTVPKAPGTTGAGILKK